MMTEPKSLELAYSGGKQFVSIGDQFRDFLSPIRWEVVGWTGDRSYSPSGLGGTPSVACRPLDELTDYWKKYLEPDGTVIWCGDSVASCMARTPVMAKDRA